MKTSIIALLLAGFSLPAVAQTNTPNAMSDIEAKIALRELVDTFSLLSDRKEPWAQTELFTENARLVTHANGAVVADLTGRQAIGSAFENFLKNFGTVYHFNGQHVVRVNGDTATGELYCLTSLFSIEDGKTMKRTIGVRYEDEYARAGGRWLISKRTSYFEWQTNEAVTP